MSYAERWLPGAAAVNDIVYRRARWFAPFIARAASSQARGGADVADSAAVRIPSALARPQLDAEPETTSRRTD